MYAAPHCRSTPNGEQLVPHRFESAARSTLLLPYIHVLPSSTDFQTSACNGAVSTLPARLHSYTAFDWSVKTQSSPLDGSAVVACVHVEPWLVDLYSSVPPPGVVAYSSPFVFDATGCSPPNRPACGCLEPGA